MSKEDVLELPKKKRLGDLFVTGEELTFDDGTEEPITVWVQKLTPKEVQKAAEQARPAKSVITSIKRLDKDSSEKWELYNQIEAADFTDLDIIKILISQKVQEANFSARAKIANEDEWAKDNYLEGLEDAWEEELRDRFIEDNEDSEAKRVMDELLRYSDQVAKEVKSVEEDLIYEMDHLDRDTLEDKFVNKLIEDRGTAALLEKFQSCQLFFATRENENRDQRYFSSVEEVEVLPEVIFNRLVSTYEDIAVDGTEVKG